MTIKPIGAFDLGAFKIDALANAPVTLKELQESALKGIQRFFHVSRTAQQGTRGTVVQRRVCADGRMLHPTKGFAKTDRGGYAKRSRRSNGT